MNRLGLKKKEEGGPVTCNATILKRGGEGQGNDKSFRGRQKRKKKGVPPCISRLYHAAKKKKRKGRVSSAICHIYFR